MGGTPKCLVHKEKSHLEMDDVGKAPIDGMATQSVCGLQRDFVAKNMSEDPHGVTHTHTFAFLLVVSMSLNL